MLRFTLMQLPTKPKLLSLGCALSLVAGTTSIGVLADENMESRMQQFEGRMQELEQQWAMQRLFETDEQLSIHGFISAGVAKTDQKAGYGHGITDDPTFAPDTTLGLQINFQVSEEVEVVTQMVSRWSEDEGFVPRGDEDQGVVAEWAYLSYQATDSLMLRAGRLRSPLFMLSDYLEVGYSYPWVRPPEEVYGLLDAFSSYWGVDFVYTVPLADWEVSFQGAYGKMRENLEGQKITADDYMGLNVTFERDAWRVRLGYNRTDGSVEPTDDLKVLDDSLRPFGVSVASDKRKATFTYAGFQFDDGDWLLTGELAQFSFDDFAVRDSDSFYLTAGYHMGRWLPYVSYAQLYTTDESDRSNLVDQLNGMGETALAASLDGFRNEQTSYTFGLRYSFGRGITAKLEASEIKEFGGTNGLFEDGVALDDSAKLYSLAVDAVF